jgi:Mg2+-importing ATPase
VHDGVQVKILTGDNDLVARHVCRQVGLDETRLVRGDEIDQMTDTALAHVVERSTIFARVSPPRKAGSSWHSSTAATWSAF